MKQTLQLKIGQQLLMTPQLQQAIRLLQLSTLELQEEIREALETNPLLEDASDGLAPNSTTLDVPADFGNADSGDVNYDNNSDISYESDFTPSDEHSLSFDNEFDTSDFTSTGLESGNESNDAWENGANDITFDMQWEDARQGASSSSSSSNIDDGNTDFDHRNSAVETLQDLLHAQLNLVSLVESDHVIALAIIDSISPSGLLGTTPQDIFDSLAKEIDIEFEEFEAVRQMIQQFDPVGVASKDLRECLLVQLQQLPAKTPFVNDAKLIVDRYLPLLGSRDFAQLKRRTKFKDGRLKEAVDLIQTLTPYPAHMIGNNNTEYIIPDVFVKKHQGQWVVELNGDCDVKLRINQDYASLIKRADNSEENNYLRNNLQEARWFIKSLQSRNETLMKVAGKIVEYQRGFLEHGDEAMRPLVLHDIAEDINMHESTISRVTTRKYMHTPRGVFELKYFFSSHVSTETGGECSSTAIRAIIKKFISNENAHKPLSDSKIADLLSDEGINVARRTIAKYRESMSIPPSNERKQLA